MPKLKSESKSESKIKRKVPAKNVDLSGGKQLYTSKQKQKEMKAKANRKWKKMKSASQNDQVGNNLKLYG